MPREGMVFWTMIALYSLGRFVVQFYRLDTEFLWGLGQAQLLAFGVGALAVWILVYQAASSRRALAVDEDREGPPGTLSPVKQPSALAAVEQCDDG
jgi:prolipoprotein diacylglyceryltransferase